MLVTGKDTVRPVHLLRGSGAEDDDSGPLESGDEIRRWELRHLGSLDDTIHPTAFFLTDAKAAHQVFVAQIRN